MIRFLSGRNGILATLAIVAIFTTVAHAHDPIPAGASVWKRTIIAEWQAKFGLEADKSLPFAQIHQESRFVATARSKYASGIAQFTPPTAEGFQRNSSALKELCADAGGCPLEPRWAIRALTLYDFSEYQAAKYAATDEDRWAFAFVAYNGGGGWVRRERAAARAQRIDDTRWFGAVEHVCVRADWACTESRGYPKVILEKWRPLYRAWLER